LTVDRGTIKTHDNHNTLSASKPLFTTFFANHTNLDYNTYQISITITEWSQWNKQTIFLHRQ